MSETTEQTPVETPLEAVPPTETQQDFVSRKDHQRAIEDMHKYKKAMLEKDEALKKLETAKLVEKEQYKDLWEKSEKEKADAIEESSKIKSAYFNGQKFSALKAECAKLGILDSAVSDLDMVDLSEVKTETTSTGRINVLNAKEIAEDIKRRRPHWFGSPGAGKVNTQVPQVVSGEKGSLMDIVKRAEDQWKKTRSAQDETAYRDALLAVKRAGH